MIIGYARVSTQDQNLNLQTDALSAAGCEKVFQEKISGKSKDRPAFNEMLAQLRKGDTVVVWKLDRLARSLKDLIDILNQLKLMEVNFLSIQDGINTDTATGRFTFNIFASLSEFERDIISERTKAGLASAKARGRTGGRPKGYSKDKRVTIKMVQSLAANGMLSVAEIMEKADISKATYYRYLEVQL